MITFDSTNIPHQPAETTKARERRLREGFFELYCKGKGIDIGAGGDPLLVGVDAWDQIYGDGDATHMAGVPDASYDYVHSSHCIEHVVFAEIAIQNWFRILKPGGHLIIFGPERDLYEKQKLLPSFWNGDHKTFWKLWKVEPPNTFSIIQTIVNALSVSPRSVMEGIVELEEDRLYKSTLSGDSERYEIVYAKKCDEGWQPLPPNKHSVGEYSFEVVIKKL